MRIAYLVSQYPTISHTFLLREIRQLRRAGFDVRVASVRSPDRPVDALLPEEKEEAERTFYIKARGWGRTMLDVLTTLAARPRAFFRGLAYAIRCAGFDVRKMVYHAAYFGQAVVAGRWMQREQLTHVHTHFSSTVALFIPGVFPISFSATIHGPEEFNDSRGFLLPHKVSRALFICAISKYSQSELAKVSGRRDWRKIEITPLGVDVDLFTPRRFRPAPDPLQILCVGRLAPVKAQHILIEAVDLLKKQDRRIMLRLVGDGAERKPLEDRVAELDLKEQVIFEGALNQKRVREIYAEADVFALASFAEGVPVVLMEAMAMEIPCVATWVMGIPELIRNEIDGLLVPPADAASLAAAIARLQDDPALRERLGRAGRLRVSEKYNIQTNIEKLGQVFEARLGAAGVRAAD